MKYALISPDEENRIVQVEEQKFDVAPPLYWIKCPLDTEPDQHYLDENKKIKLKVVPQQQTTKTTKLKIEGKGGPPKNVA